MTNEKIARTKLIPCLVSKSEGNTIKECAYLQFDGLEDLAMSQSIASLRMKTLLLYCMLHFILKEMFEKRVP